MKTNYWEKFEETCFYHVYNRSINRERLLKTEDNYNFFYRKTLQYLTPYFDIAGYCLLPNHFHFLLRVNPIDNDILLALEKEKTAKACQYLNKEIPYHRFLEDQFKRLFSSYALAFN